MDWTQQGNPERDLFEAALGGSHKCTLVRRSKSSEGGTRTPDTRIMIPLL